MSKVAARIAQLEALERPLDDAERFEAQELRRQLRCYAALRLRYLTDPQYRWHKMRQRATAYARQKRARRRNLTRPILTLRTMEAAE